MNQNKQDNKPEITAMQELIEYVETQQEKHAGNGANGIWRQCQRIIDKAIELRDTVEKDKMINFAREFNKWSQQTLFTGHVVTPEMLYDRKRYNHGK